jgi:hypothetical protein
VIDNSYWKLLPSELVKEVTKYLRIDVTCGISGCTCENCNRIACVSMDPCKLLHVRIEFERDLFIHINGNVYKFIPYDFPVIQDLFFWHREELVSLIQKSLSSNLIVYEYKGMRLKLTKNNYLIIRTDEVEYTIHVRCKCAVPIIRDKLLNLLKRSCIIL